MSILDKMEQSTRVVQTKPIFTKPTYSEDLQTIPDAMHFTYEHKMSVTVEHTFFCNTAQLSDAKKLARGIISRTLMQSAIDAAQDLRAAVYAEDYESMHKLLDKLLEELR